MPAAFYKVLLMTHIHDSNGNQKQEGLLLEIIYLG